jgi:integral membrane sensor domain MASE1
VQVSTSAHLHFLEAALCPGLSTQFAAGLKAWQPPSVRTTSQKELPSQVTGGSAQVLQLLAGIPTTASVLQHPFCLASAIPTMNVQVPVMDSRARKILSLCDTVFLLEVGKWAVTDSMFPPFEGSRKGRSQ